MEKNPIFPHIITGINTGQASFQFKGHFHNQPVTWQCTLQTLEHHYQSLIATRQIADTENVMLKKFIHIHDDKSPTPHIHIGLDVDCIDKPTILKAIIMVHNYKQLHAGRHEYGTAYRYPGK